MKQWPTMLTIADAATPASVKSTTLNDHMKILKKQALRLAMLGILASTAVASNAIASITPNTVNLGAIAAPFSMSYGNTFSVPSLLSFYDDYTFTLSPAASFSSITASINLGSFFGIDNISARLYQGSGPFSAGTTPLMQAWSTPFSAAPGITGSTAVISMSTLPADTYTLEIRGNVVGTYGGTYSGSLNVAAIPEPETYALLMAGLGLIGFVARRKNVKSVESLNA